MAGVDAGKPVVSRVVRIVGAFAPEERALGVSEIARRTGLPVATVSRLVEQLVRFGWLERQEDRRVRVGVRLWEVDGEPLGWLATYRTPVKAAHIAGNPHTNFSYWTPATTLATSGKRPRTHNCTTARRSEAHPTRPQVRRCPGAATGELDIAVIDDRSPYQARAVAGLSTVRLGRDRAARTGS